MSEAFSVPGRGIKPLVSLKAHPQLAALAAAVVITLGIPFAWIKGTPKYTTESVLQIAPRYMKNLREDQELEFQSNTQYRQYVQHEIRSVTRFDILEEALKRSDAKVPPAMRWQRANETPRRAIERLQSTLLVAAVPDTYMVRISLEGGKKEGLAEVVNAVTETFLERAKEEQIYGSGERATNLRQRERELLDVIAAKGAKRAEIARDLSLTTFNEGTPNPYDQLVAGLRGRVSDARQRRLDAEAAMGAFKGHGDTNVSIRSISDAVLNDPGLNALKSALYKRRAELLLQTSGLKAEHPVRQAATQELREIDLELQQQSGVLAHDVRANLLSRLAGTADQARKVEEGLSAELATLEQRATEFAQLFQSAMMLTSELTQARLELEKVRDRLNYLNVESSSLGFIRLVTPALAPELPFGPGRKKLLLMVLMAAMAAGVLVPVVRDFLDPRLYTVHDVERQMGMAAAGWQIERSDAAAGLFAEEQLRRLASSLMRSRQNGQGKIFGFTGIKPGVGTTSLLMDLAVMLRQLGLKVVVIEANGFSHDSRYDSDRPGMVEFLSGAARASQIVAPPTADLPMRVSVGGVGRVQLQRLDRLADLLRRWSTSVDFILVDMPPLLVAADAELIARTVGNVMMVVEAGVTVKGDVQRAKRLLLKIDPPAVGVVVNRIKPFTDGGDLQQQILESILGRQAMAFYTTSPLKLWMESVRLRLQRYR